MDDGLTMFIHKRKDIFAHQYLVYWILFCLISHPVCLQMVSRWVQTLIIMFYSLSRWKCQHIISQFERYACYIFFLKNIIYKKLFCFVLFWNARNATSSSKSSKNTVVLL